LKVRNLRHLYICEPLLQRLAQRSLTLLIEEPEREKKYGHHLQAAG
jgi:hypothetical protein